MPQLNRIKQETNITRVAEAVAARTDIHWNALTNDALIQFWVSQVITENGVLKKIEPDTRSVFSPLHINFADIINRTFLVPIAYDELGNVTATAPVPALLIMGAIKTAFDELYLEKLNAMYPEPSVTPTATPPTTPEASTTSITPTPSAT